MGGGRRTPSMTSGARDELVGSHFPPNPLLVKNDVEMFELPNHKDAFQRLLDFQVGKEDTFYHLRSRIPVHDISQC